MAEFTLDLNDDQKAGPRLDPRLRRRRDPPRRRRVGRARGDPLARHPGGRQDRPLLPRLLRPAVLRPDRPRHPHGDGGAVLGRRGHRACPSSAPAWPPSASSPTAPRSRSAPGSRRCTATPTTSRSPPSAPPSPTPAPTSAAMRTRAVYDEAKDEWVLNGTKTWATNGGIANVHVVVAVGRPRTGLQGPRLLHRPAGHPRPLPGPEVQEARHPRLAHRRGRPGGRPRPRRTACSAARRSWTSASPGPASAPRRAASA